MDTTSIYLVGASALLAIGLSALALRRTGAHQVLAVNICSMAVMLGMVAIARRAGQEVPDPIPHALVLTGLILTVAATAVGLMLVRSCETADDDETEP